MTLSFAKSIYSEKWDNVLIITLQLWKESLNSDVHLFCQYQQNEQSLLILTEVTECK